MPIKNDKSQIAISIITILMVIVASILVYLLLEGQIREYNLITGKVISEKASISLTKGMEYSSEFETENKSTEKIWVIASSILKVLVGIAIVIIAIAILIKVLKKKK